MSAIGAVTHLVDLADSLGHDLIIRRALTGRAATPIVESTAADLAVFAHGLYRLDGLICMNQRVDVLPAMLSLLANHGRQAFARMSRSWEIWRA